MGQGLWNLSYAGATLSPPWSFIYWVVSSANLGFQVCCEEGGPGKACLRHLTHPRPCRCRPAPPPSPAHEHSLLQPSG